MLRVENDIGWIELVSGIVRVFDAQSRSTSVTPLAAVTSVSFKHARVLESGQLSFEGAGQPSALRFHVDDDPAFAALYAAIMTEMTGRVIDPPVDTPDPLAAQKQIFIWCALAGTCAVAVLTLYGMFRSMS